MPKIFWKPEEKTLLAREWERLTKENPAALVKERVVKVQLVLPVERRRRLTYGSAASRIRLQLEDWLKGLAAPTEAPALPVRIEPEDQARGLTYADLEALPVGLLVGVVVDRLLARTLLADTPQAPTVTRTLAPSGPPVRLTLPSEPPRERKVKIGILGLVFEQFQQLKQRVNGHLCDLVFVNKEHNPAALPPSVNYCIVQRHVSHQWFEQAQGSVGAERTFFVDGGISGVLQKVNEVLAKVN